jgi:hypothetical protein
MPVSTFRPGPVAPALVSAWASGWIVLTGMFVSTVPSVIRTRVPDGTLAAASTGLTASSVRVPRGQQLRGELGDELREQAGRVHLLAGPELGDRAVDPLRLLLGIGRRELALLHGRVELLVELHGEQAQDPLVLRFEQGQAGRVGRDGVGHQHRVEAALAVPDDEHALPVDPRLGNQVVVGVVGLADEGVEVDGAGVGGEGARASLPGEVLVEPERLDALLGEHARDQLQGLRGDVRGRLVAVAVGGAAAGQQQRGGQLLATAVRRYLQRAVGFRAVDGERDVTAGRRDLSRRRRARPGP